MAFQIQPRFFKWFLVSTVSLLTCLVDCLKFQDESKIGGSRVCLYPLFRLLKCTITVCGLLLFVLTSITAKLHRNFKIFFRNIKIFFQ